MQTAPLRFIGNFENDILSVMRDEPLDKVFEVDDWTGCYREGWKGLIVEKAFAHPAKYSRSLIQRIYKHACEQGWLLAGQTVVDCFGGVALGGFDAAMNGAHWIGCELESKFIELGNENIEEWKHRYGHRAGCGSVRLIQGDSRKLGDALREAQIVVSSPPYNLPMSQGHNGSKGGTRGTTPSEDGAFVKYGNTPGQLEGLPMTEAGLTLAIASPPYVRALGNAANYADPDKAEADSQRAIMQTNGGASADKRYSADPANLGTMKEGDFALVVSSPPYSELGQKQGTDRRREEFFENEKQGLAANVWRNGYGTSDGQLGAMRDKGFDLSVSSPPYETARVDQEFQRKAANRDVSLSMPEATKGYGDSGTGRERTQQAQDDFWSAARQIVEETYKVLAPGARAVWVVKGFVRKRTYVDFPDQWRQLCEAVGFETLHWHRAWLTEKGTQQHRFDGGIDDNSIERKSYFRRLAEKNGSPRIDFEVVLCQVKR